MMNDEIVLQEFLNKYATNPNAKFLSLDSHEWSGKQEVFAYANPQKTEIDSCIVELSKEEVEAAISNAFMYAIERLSNEVAELKRQLLHTVPFGDPTVFVEAWSTEDIQIEFPDLSEEQARYIIGRLEKTDLGITELLHDIVDFHSAELKNIALSDHPYSDISTPFAAAIERATQAAAAKKDAPAMSRPERSR
jgi:hypothetical protein